MKRRVVIIFSMCFVLVAGALPAHAQDDAAREAEWRRILREGIDAYQRGDTEEAIAKWEAANRVYDRRPEGYNNIAVVLADRGDHGRAASMYQQALAAYARMRAPLDSEREERRSLRRDVHQGLLSSGEELFRQGRTAAAAEALAALTAADPRNREAWYNLALALYRLERWAELLDAARHVVELDPLNYNARVLLVDAAKRQNVPAEIRSDAAAAGVPLPIHLEDVQLIPGTERVTLRGTATGVTAPAGTPIRLEVALYDSGDPAGNHTVTVTAPAKGQKAMFSVVIPTSEAVTGFSYQWIP